jgi:predicted dehydrogenase
MIGQTPTEPIKFDFEFKNRIRVGFVGAGDHSFRNLYPSLKYAPAELIAVCDLRADRAYLYAKEFGANAHYTDYREMLAREKLDAVFIVTSYDSAGHPHATAIAREALAHGVSVWMEKPTAASSAEVRDLISVRDATGARLMTGLKKMFTPGVQKLRAILGDAEFGSPSSLFVRYPLRVPSRDERTNTAKLVGFLDHIYHPAAIVQCLFGPIHRMSYELEPWNGGAVVSLRFVTGAIGTMHLVAGMSSSSPLEYVEIVGQQTNAILRNGIDLTYHRRTPSPPYGRTLSYVCPDEAAPLHWEPEFSLGQLYNQGLFLLGYAPEVIHFCESLLAGRAPELGTLEDSLEIMKLYEALLTTEPGHAVIVNEMPA